MARYAAHGGEELASHRAHSVSSSRSSEDARPWRRSMFLRASAVSPLQPALPRSFLETFSASPLGQSMGMMSGGVP